MIHNILYIIHIKFIWEKAIWGRFLIQERVWLFLLFLRIGHISMPVDFLGL